MRSLCNHQIEGSVRTHLDRNRTPDSEIVREHLGRQGFNELNELAKRIGFDDQPGNVARGDPDARLWIPCSVNVKALFHARIMRAVGRNGKPVPSLTYIRSGASMPSRSRASSSCFSVAAARARREAATLASTSRKIGQAA